MKGNCLAQRCRGAGTLGAGTGASACVAGRLWTGLSRLRPPPRSAGARGRPSDCDTSGRARGGARPRGWRPDRRARGRKAAASPHGRHLSVPATASGAPFPRGRNPASLRGRSRANAAGSDADSRRLGSIDPIWDMIDVKSEAHCPARAAERDVGDEESRRAAQPSPQQLPPRYQTPPRARREDGVPGGCPRRSFGRWRRAASSRCPRSPTSPTRRTRRAGRVFLDGSTCASRCRNHHMMLEHYHQTKNLPVSYSPKALGLF
jgi:hypothetical protein